jgi:ribosomal-protein-alanine N-acetyltransferase
MSPYSHVIAYHALQEEDLEALSALEAMTNPVPWSRALFAAELEQPQTCTWILGWMQEAGLGLMPMGSKGLLVSMGGFWKAVDEAHITNIAVHPNFRRQGLGASLMKELLRHAASLGCLRATLEVRQGNQSAISMYESQGFERVAMRPRYYPDTLEDALILWKNGLEASSHHEPNQR